MVKNTTVAIWHARCGVPANSYGGRGEAPQALKHQSGRIPYMLCNTKYHKPHHPSATFEQFLNHLKGGKNMN